MAKARYSRPTVKTTVPPQMALDIDKPCSFIWPPDKKKATTEAEVLKKLLLQAGAKQLDPKVVRRVWEEMQAAEHTKKRKGTRKG